MTSATTLALPLVFTLVYFSPHTALPRWEHLPFLGSPEAHDFHHSLNGGRNLDNLGQVDVLDRVLHTNKEFLKSWQYTVHKGYTTPDYPVDKALATTEKPLPA